MAITSRKGPSDKLDKNKLVSGEDALTLDKKEILYCVGPGDVRELATTKSVNDLLTAVPELYDKLQMLVGELENETLLQGILGDIEGNASDLVTHKADNASAHGIDTKANKIQPAWNYLTLQNGWGVSSAPRYRKNEFGELQLQGRIIGGTTTGGTVLFTLPDGYRVAGTRILVTTSYLAVESKNLVLNFAPNGEVSIHASSQSLTVVTLENITIAL